jgi:hypothetical protein
MKLSSLGGWCLAVTVVGAGNVAADIIVEGPNGALVAYIRDAGRVEDAAFRPLGYVRPGGRVEDARFRTLGYVGEDGSVRDATYYVLGYFRPGGRVEDSSYRTVGYVREGFVQDVRLATVGLYRVGEFDGDVDAALAAYVFFFSPVFFVQPEWETADKP